MGGELGAEFKAIHAVEFFWEYIERGIIVPKKSLRKKVVYHDPCTLGRQSGIYDPPRNILKSIPGLDLLEVEDFSRNLSLCCGAGSGALWIDWPKGERMADVRVKQLVDTGAEIIAVACPYCLQMFEETVKAMNVNIVVKDVTELLLSFGADVNATDLLSRTPLYWSSIRVKKDGVCQEVVELLRSHNARY